MATQENYLDYSGLTLYNELIHNDIVSASTESTDNCVFIGSDDGSGITPEVITDPTAVKFTEQTLSPTEQAQARTNISAASQTTVTQLSGNTAAADEAIRAAFSVISGITGDIDEATKVLRNGKVFIMPDDVNHGVLTQAMMNQPNTIYVISGDMTLSGNSVNVPSGSTLSFEGGTISNGTMTGYDTVVISESNKSPFNGVTRMGTWQSEDDVDVPYSGGTYNGMGRIVLKKHYDSQNPGYDKQPTLYQTDFPSENTVYIVRYDFVLEENITIPSGSVLEFDGGSVSGNGTGKDTITGNHTGINAGLVKIFNTNITLDGTWTSEGHIRWFGASENNEDNTIPLTKTFSSFYNVIVDDGEYHFSSTVEITCSNLIKGGDLYSNNTLVYNGTGSALHIKNERDTPYITIDGISIKYDVAYFDDGYVFKQGTRAIDTTIPDSGDNSIHVVNCWIKGFEYGIYANASYYNTLIGSRIENARYIYVIGHTNGLNICNNRFLGFETAISLGAGGPTIIKGNSFEIFAGGLVIVNNSGINGSLTFSDNYVEGYGEDLYAGYTPNASNKMYGQNLFYGVIRNFISIGNEFEISNAFRLYYINIEDFYSVGNTISLFDNSSLDAYSVLGAFPGTLAKRIIGKDTCNKGNNVTYAGGSPSFYGISDYNTEIDYIDPINNIPNVKYNGLDIAVDTSKGYSLSSAGAIVFKNETDMVLYGKITRNSNPVNKVSFMQLPAGCAVNYASTDRNQTINLVATSSVGNIVVLQYHYDTRYFDIIKGEDENDIDLTGLTIPVRR